MVVGLTFYCMDAGQGILHHSDSNHMYIIYDQPIFKDKIYTYKNPCPIYLSVIFVANSVAAMVWF